MNTKGFLLGEETLKIIIAVIAISFLIYLLFSLYYANKSSKNLELAKASLERLIKEINAGSTEVEIYNPKGWSVISFPQILGVAYDSKKSWPRECSNKGWKNCLCICDTGEIRTIDVFSKPCDKKGVCMENDFRIKYTGFLGIGEVNAIPIESPPLILSIDHENKIIQKAG